MKKKISLQFTMKHIEKTVVRCAYEDLRAVGEEFGRDQRSQAYQQQLKCAADTLGSILEEILEEAYRKLP